MKARVFDTREEAQEFAESQRGKVFRRTWTLEEMQQQTLGWQEAYDEEQRTGEPRWATRLLERWKSHPNDCCAYDLAPAGEVIEDKGRFYVPLGLVDVSVDYDDAPLKRTVRAVVQKEPTDKLAVELDADVVREELAK